MSERSLGTQWTQWSCAFQDSAAGRTWLERDAVAVRAGLTLLRESLAEDLSCAPQGLDGEHVRDLLTRLLPARMGDAESFAAFLPDLLEDFLLFTAQECGLANEFELRHAIAEARAGYERALTQTSRPRLAPKPLIPDRRPGSKLGRNDPCPCGSGRKYKKCCGANA